MFTPIDAMASADPGEHAKMKATPIEHCTWFISSAMVLEIS